MKPSKRQLLVVAMLGLAGCSFGPHLQTALPQVRDVPVLAGLSPGESFVRARTFLAARQYGLAIELFKTASRDPALEADSLNGLAVAYDGIGRQDLAERYFQRALAARPGDQRTKRNLAAFYATSGQDEKRRQLMAGRLAVPQATPTEVAATPDAGASELGVVPASLAAAPTPAPALQLGSPLGAALRPLLANALFPSTKSNDTAVPDGDVSVVCKQENSASAAGGSMAMFRISIGEVFITAQPAGSRCVVEGEVLSAPMTTAGAPISNKEYLGFVAAYLDRINKLQSMNDIAIAWKAAFWAQDGEA